MTTNHIKALVVKYIIKLDSLKDSSNETIEHCYRILIKMKVILESETVTKTQTNRLNASLGFVQGCLWVSKVYSLEEIKKDNSV